MEVFYPQRESGKDLIFGSEDKVLIVEKQNRDPKDLLERVVRELRTQFPSMVARVNYARVRPVGRRGVMVSFWSPQQAEEAEKWLDEHFKK